MRTSLVVTPTPESVKRIQDIVQGTVLAVINGDLMNLEVIATEHSPAPVWVPSEATYADAQVKDVQVDTQIATNGAITRLVAWVESASLARRRQELGGSYNPMFAWVLLYDVPPGRSAMLTISHLTDVLVFREPPFSFNDEMLLQV